MTTGAAAVAAGLMTVNEWRELEGLTPLPDPPAPVPVPVPVPEPPAIEPPPPEPTPITRSAPACQLRVIPLGPAPVDIKGVRAGDLNQFRMTINAAGAPVDLTGMEVTASARVKPNDTRLPWTPRSRSWTPPGGVITIAWPGEAVREWMGSKATVNGVWDLQIASTGSDPILPWWLDPSAPRWTSRR